jgi:cell division protein FtsA
MTKDAKNLIVGLDIGTSKVVAVVAEVLPNGRHEVIGLGQHESKGLKKGVVVNIEATVESIRRALEEAELMDTQCVHRHCRQSHTQLQFQRHGRDQG